jgi:predicted AlkP superfamily phosphohydrolase/phosphomutase
MKSYPSSCERRQMPNLEAIFERGAMGRVATLHPPLSPSLWTSIATGKRSFKHGIRGFPNEPQDGRSVRPITKLCIESNYYYAKFHQSVISI